MRLRLAGLLAAATAAALATPSHAFVGPVCTATLVEAPAGAVSGNCYSNATSLNGLRRYLVVEVAEGAVDARLTCFFPSGPYTYGPYRVSGVTPRLINVRYDQGSCYATLTAVVDHTTAVLVSTPFLDSPR